MAFDISELQIATRRSWIALTFGASITCSLVVSGITTDTVELIASSASCSAATSSGAARTGASGPVPLLYCPTRRPRPAHSASARKSRIENRLKSEYQHTARPRPSRVG